MQHLTLEVHSFFAASFMPVIAMTASSGAPRRDFLSACLPGEPGKMKSGRATEAC